MAGDEKNGSGSDELDALLREVAKAPDVPLPTRPRHLEGQRVGRYELHCELGHGGMGAVYLGRLRGDEGFDRLVAVKVIHSHLARDEHFVTMFLDEARVVSRIIHPHVCQVLDFGNDSGVAFLVMEYLRGEPLSALIDRAGQCSGVPFGLVARVVSDAARGLHAAHEAHDSAGRPLEVVHRDVSPSNLVVTYDGVTKLLDFGVAKARGRLQETTGGQVKGKLPYMAPEQLKGGDVDRRCDVWALGVTLWEATTGRHPFRGKNEGETITRVLQMPIPRPSSVVSGYPKLLEEAVMACLVRDVSKRTQDAAAVADAMDELLHHLDEPVGHTQVGRWMETHLGEEIEARQKLELSGSQAPGGSPAPWLDGDTVEDPAMAKKARGRPSWPFVLLAGLLLGGGTVAGLLFYDPAGWLSATESPTAAAERFGDAPLIPQSSLPEPPRPSKGDAAAEQDAETRADAEAPTVKRVATSNRPGTLSLYVVPSARVTLDGRPAGETPLTLKVRPGRHRLVFTTGDGRQKRMSVRVRPGQTLRRSFSFDP